MQLGMIGLGRMGGNMADRCMRSGHSMVVTDLSKETVQKYVQKGATAPAAWRNWSRSWPNRDMPG